MDIRSDVATRAYADLSPPPLVFREPHTEPITTPPSSGSERKKIDEIWGVLKNARKQAAQQREGAAEFCEAAGIEWRPVATLLHPQELGDNFASWDN